MRPVAERLNKRKAVGLLAQAQLHQAKGEFARVAELVREVVSHSDLASAELYGTLCEALVQLGRLDDAEAALEDGFRRFPRAVELLARQGTVQLQRGRADLAVVSLEKARQKFGREPGFLVQLAAAYAEAGRSQDAEKTAAQAIAVGAGDDARLVLAVAKGHLGQYAAARTEAQAVLGRAKEPALRRGALALLGDLELFLGDGPAALEAFRTLEREGALEPAHLGHMAYAAELAQDHALADRLVAQCAQGRPTAEDRLLFAQIQNLRQRPQEALEQLEAAFGAPGTQHPGHAYEVLATKGRALRLLGRRDEARQALQAALAMPEAASARLGPRVRVDLGHLAAEEGAFEEAQAHFEAALALDPGDPEAARARELTLRRVAWRTELQASTGAQVEAAKAEAEAMRRRFQAREGELEALRAELERLKASKATAEDAARRAQQDAQAAAERAKAEQDQKLREELALREQEVDQKARDNIDRALGRVSERCPQHLLNLLTVAERTYQKALYTDLPAAAVAVLFSGALERALYTFFVEAFDRWLDASGQRRSFLDGAVREKRGRRVEYFDHFVEAFDTERAGKAPAMGEVGRVLERRHESYLRPFREFLHGSYAVQDSFYDELADFVQWSKERLRDPVAHGRGIELGYDELKRFREKLLFDFRERGQGALALLLASK